MKLNEAQKKLFDEITTACLEFHKTMSEKYGSTFLLLGTAIATTLLSQQFSDRYKKMEIAFPSVPKEQKVDVEKMLLKIAAANELITEIYKENAIYAFAAYSLTRVQKEILIKNLGD